MVFFGTGILLLYLLDLEGDKGLVEGLGLSEIGEMSGLPIPLLFCPPSLVRSDPGGETSISSG